MRKRVILAICGVAFCLSMTACGSTDAGDKAPASQSASESDRNGDTKESAAGGEAESPKDKEGEKTKENEKPTGEETNGSKDAEENPAGEETDGAKGEEGGASGEEKGKEEGSDTVYQIGESVDLKDWNITVTGFQIEPSIDISFGSYSPEEEGNQYALVSVNVTNNGKEVDSFLPSFGMGDDISTKLLFGDGYEFTSTVLIVYDRDMHDSYLNPFSTKEGDIVFNIPEAVYGSEDELLIQFKSGFETIKFKIRSDKKFNESLIKS